MRRPILTAAAPACLLLGLTPIAASAGEAPAGKATAAALQAGSLVGVSKTGASADPAKAEGQASVLSVGDQTILGTGGSQPSEGETNGALVDTGTAAPVRAQVAPWQASSTGSKNSARRSSKASAALARAEAPGGIKAGVLTSDSQAEHKTEQSTALSTSDAVDVELGEALRLVLLHSEVGSTGQGHSYLVQLNGTKIGTDEDSSKICSLDAAGVASLSCLTASGGVADGITSGGAEVLGVATTLGLDPAAAFKTSASFGSGSVTPPILPAVAEALLPAAEAPRMAAAPAAGGLPRTGVAAASLGASGLAALLSGSALRLIGRRRRRIS
jgi:hypothetical protein